MVWKGSTLAKDIAGVVCVCVCMCVRVRVCVDDDDPLLCAHLCLEMIPLCVNVCGGVSECVCTKIFCRVLIS